MPERKIECSYGSIVITDDHGLYLYAERDRERVGVSLRPEDARKIAKVLAAFAETNDID